ncbi:hypothetical protein EBZ80_09210 [bacterium]|nr:hypothetical protein [bacterium]
MSEETLGESQATETTSDVSSSQAEAVSQPQDVQSQPQQAQQDVWSSFRALPDFKGQDDRAIAGRLYASLEREKAATKRLEQYQQLIPYAQEYLTYRPEFEKWRSLQEQSARQQMQPAPQQQPPRAQSWWNPPEVRESYKQYLVKDENGREVIDPNAPLDAKHALYEYQKYKADFAQKFLSDPQAALGPMVEKVATERAREIVEAQLREASEVGYVQNLDQQNRDWLYNQDGTPTREGLMIQSYIQAAAKRGIRSPQERWEFACDMVERDLLREVNEQRASQAQRSQFEQALPSAQAPATQAPAQNQAETDMNYLRREASRNPSRSGPASDPRIPQGPMTFEQRLRRKLAPDGVLSER